MKTWVIELTMTDDELEELTHAVGNAAEAYTSDADMIRGAAGMMETQRKFRRLGRILDNLHTKLEARRTLHNG